jgi:hypothetical protein
MLREADASKGDSAREKQTRFHKSLALHNNTHKSHLNECNVSSHGISQPYPLSRLNVAHLRVHLDATPNDSHNPPIEPSRCILGKL